MLGLVLIRGARRFGPRPILAGPVLGLSIAGALLMGVGGIIALGCTIGHGLSGLSLLSLGSLLSLVAIAAGVELGRRLFPAPHCVAP